MAINEFACESITTESLNTPRGESLRIQSVDVAGMRSNELARRYRYLSDRVASLSDGIVISKANLDWPLPEIVYVNEEMTRITGYSADELIGQARQVFSGVETDHSELQRICRELSENRSVTSEIVQYRKDGSEYCAELQITPVLDPNGRRTNYVAIHRDVSHRRELQRLVLEIAAEEQRRLGQDLHDSLQQELTGLGFLAQSIAAKLGKWSASDADRAVRLASGIKELNAQVQMIAHGMVPIAADMGGLRMALTRLASRSSERCPVECAFLCDEHLDVTDRFTATHMFRIAQEAVNNAMKHGHASRIEVSLRRFGRFVSLAIADNGGGFDETRSSPPGVGLQVMRYRADLIGASFQVSRREEGGTYVNCAVETK